MGMKEAKGQTGSGQQHLYSRTSYLYQAAMYLASIQSHLQTHNRNRTELDVDVDEKHAKTADDNTPETDAISEDELKHKRVDGEASPTTPFTQQRPQSRLLVQHLKAISLKAQIRLTSEMKYSACKRCDSILVAGKTATHNIENQSRGGKKPWADILTITCNSCGATKRFPVGAKRQRRRSDRKRQDDNAVRAP